jgi:hypothetical protein
MSFSQPLRDIGIAALVFQMGHRLREAGTQALTQSMGNKSCVQTQAPGSVALSSGVGKKILVCLGSCFSLGVVGEADS